MKKGELERIGALKLKDVILYGKSYARLMEYCGNCKHYDYWHDGCWVGVQDKDKVRGGCKRFEKVWRADMWEGDLR